MRAQARLRTPAWLLVGLFGNRPGVLELSGGRLAFHTGEGCLFDAPLAEVTAVTFPWYYFSGGVKVTVQGKRYRFSFVRPNGAEDVPGQVLAREGNPLGLLTAGQKVVDIGSGRQAGKAWREALAVNQGQVPAPSP